MTAIQADYVIIGGGLTGCAVASRLKQGNASLDVIGIEAGPDPTDDHRTTSPLGGFALGKSNVDRAYQSVAQPQINDRSFHNAVGKSLGGGSILHYGGWSRGDASVYNERAKLVRDDRWSYEGLIPYLRKSEHSLGPSPDIQQRGFDGPMRLATLSSSDSQRVYALREPVLAAWKELGMEYIANGNSGRIAGIQKSRKIGIMECASHLMGRTR